MRILLAALIPLLSPQPSQTSGPTPAASSQIPPEAQAEVEKANLLIASQRFRDAAEALERANKLAGGKCFTCLEAKAAARIRLNDLDGALADANEALKVGASKEYRARAYNQIGLANAARAKKDDRDIKELAAAEEAFRHALEADPNLNAARFHLARILIRERRDKDADAVLDDYIKRETAGPLADQAKALKENHRRATESFAPAFRLKTLDEKTITLESLRGKVVLLDFWATWCGPCIKALPELKDIRKKFAGRPFELISISVDREKKKLEEFVKSNNMTWPQGFDEGLRVARETFGVNSFPTYFVLDGEGLVTYVARGYSPATAGRLTDEIQKALQKPSRKS